MELFLLGIIVFGMLLIFIQINKLTSAVERIAYLLREEREEKKDSPIKCALEQLVWTISGISSSGLTYNDESMMDILNNISNTLKEIETEIRLNRL